MEETMLMNCKDVERYLVDRALKIPSGQNQDALEKHLQACPHCRALAQEYRAVSVALQPETSAATDIDMADRVVALASKKKGTQDNIRRMTFSVAAVAALFLMTIVTPFMLSNRQEGTTDALVLDSYIEAWEALSSQSGNATGYSAFSYEDYGVPLALSQYLEDESL